tara:strand:+ start:759 stop:1886 length:1128 start_codon:yes stop_codon:yes gene_type:complete
MTYSSTLLCVDIRNLLEGKTLKDNTTHLNVAISCRKMRVAVYVKVSVVSPRAFAALEALPCTVLSDGKLNINGTEYAAPEGSNFFVNSIKRLRAVVKAHHDELLPQPEEIDEHMLVGIQASSIDKSKRWEGAGVFLEPCRAEYLKTIREKGVHALGRVALMHRTLFGIIGVSKSPSEPFFNIVDAWEGSVNVSRDEVLSCINEAARTLVKNVQPESGKELINIMVDNVEDEVEESYRIELSSEILTSGTKASNLTEFFNIIMALRGNEAKSLDFIRTRNIANVSIDLANEVETLLGKRIVDLYVDRMITKMNDSAVQIGDIPDGVVVNNNTIEKLNTSNGIYGVYSKVSPRENDGLYSFDDLPWAVAASFVDTCL